MIRKRPTASPAIRANNLVFFAVGAAIYSDILKWYFPGGTALALSYGALLGLLFLIAEKRIPRGLRAAKTARMETLGVGLIIATYLMRGVLSFDVELFRTFVGIAYIALPLVFLVSLRKIAPFIDLDRLGMFFFVLMIPVQAVGLVQYFVDPTFFVFSSYSEDGGVISRNLLDAGAFNRMPSIFASADRYSAMAAIHAYLALVLLLVWRPSLSTWGGAWLTCNLGLGVLGILISGARSRIILIVVTVLVGFLASIFVKKYRDGNKSYMLIVKTIIGVLIISGVTGGIYLSSENFGVIDLFRQSFEKGDIELRIAQAIEMSHVNDGTGIIGAGIGSLSLNGTPGEFGIRSLWIEMGFLFTPFVLAGFAMILSSLIRNIGHAIKTGNVAMVIGLTYPALVLLGGIFIGLKFSLELSTGIMIALGIALCRARLAEDMRSRQMRKVAGHQGDRRHAGWRNFVAA